MDKDFEKSLAPWFGKTIKLIENKIEDVLLEENIDLSKNQFVILKTISSNKGICQNELAFYANRNKSSLTRMINTLEKKNYLARIPSQEDKRMNNVIITKQGLSILEKAEPIFIKFAKSVEKGLSKEEIENTIITLKKIQKNVSDQEVGMIFKHIKK